MSKINESFNLDICSEVRFRDAFDSYFKALRNFLIYKYGNHDQAEDLAQNAFVVLWENCKKVPPEKAKSFLYTTAIRQNLNVIKHNKVVQNFNYYFKFDSIDKQTPEFLLEESELKNKLEKAINNLPEKQRVVFMMSRFENQTYKEIASLLGLSVKAVERRMHLALQSLRDVLKKI